MFISAVCSVIKPVTSGIIAVDRRLKLETVFGGVMPLAD